MAIFLLKKSYQASNQKEIGFKDLWGSHGVFTTIRLLGKPGKLILFKSHFKGLIKSLKKYKIYGFQFHPDSFLTENGNFFIKKILSSK